MSKIVGVKIGTKSPHTQDKIYYYKTDNDYKRGDKITVKVPSGGTPEAVIVDADSKRKIRNAKNLEIGK